MERNVEREKVERQNARSLAREIARAYQGKLKSSGEYEWDRGLFCYFVVKGSYGGRALTFQVCNGACIVDGATTRRPAAGFSWNYPIERIDRPVKGALPKGAIPAFHFRYYKGGKELPPPGLETLGNELRAFWEDTASRDALLDVRLQHNESLLLLEHPMFGAGHRPHFYLVHRSPDLSELTRRLDALSRFLPAVPAGADVAKVVSARAHRIKIGGAKRSGPSRHRFGGSLDDAPECENCRTPVHLILTIDTSDASLGLPKLGRRVLPIVYCLNCMSWKPLYVDYSADGLRIIRQAKEDKANDDSPIDERPVSFTPLPSPNTSVSKVGGSPTWLQGPDIPDCATCAQPMTFFAQLKSLPDLGFGDDGVLYAFVCISCKVSATFIQSH